MELKVNVTIRKENGWFIAICEDYSLSARGTSIEQVLAELQKKLNDYLKDEHPCVEASIVFTVKMPV